MDCAPCRAIHDAVETGILKMVQVLVEHGADPCTEFLERTPCEMAQSLGHKEIHSYLQGQPYLSGHGLWLPS